MRKQSSVGLQPLLKIKDCSSVDVCSAVHVALEKPGRAGLRCDNKQDVIKISVDWLYRLYSDRPKSRKKKVKFLLK